MKHVLVVEDEPDIRELLSDILGHVGYIVETAADGEEALKHVDRHTPDVVLLDLMLPGIDGFEVARQFRDRGIYASIVILTAMHDVEDYMRRIETPFGLAKPFNIDELIELLGQATTQKKAAPAGL